VSIEKVVDAIGRYPITLKNGGKMVCTGISARIEVCMYGKRVSGREFQALGVELKT